MKRFIFLDFDGVMDTTHHTNWLYHEGLPENDRYGVVFDPESIGHIIKRWWWFKKNAHK